jgi:DNA (cytosine-5)-methyltransferase 1
MAAVLRTVRPDYVVVENVAALVRDQAAFGTILRDLHTLGFDAEWSTLSAAQFGAPHRRERVYLVAYPTRDDGRD